MTHTDKLFNHVSQPTPGLAGWMIWYYYTIISYSHTFPIQHYIIWYPTIPIPCHHFPGIVSLRYYVILSYQLTLLFLLSVRLSFKWVHASFNSSNQQGYQASWYCLPHYKSIGVLNVEKNACQCLLLKCLWFWTDHYSKWGCHVHRMRLLKRPETHILCNLHIGRTVL